MIARAFEVWSRHSKLTFSEVDSDRADILIYFYSRDHGDNFDFDGRGVVLAHAFFPNGGKSTEVHFDADEEWSLSSDPNADGTNFFNVAAHEFGHSLGLAHSAVDTALMYPWYKEIEDNGFDFELPDDDKNAIRTLYGFREDRQWGRIKPYKPPTTTTTTTTQRTHRTWTVYPRPTRLPERPRVQPYDPRYPNGMNPKYPYKPNKFPYYPTKPRYHPKEKPVYIPTKSTKRPVHIPSHTTRTTPVTRSTVKIHQKASEHPRNEHHHHHHTTTQPPPATPVPNTCDTSYDAISVIRTEVFIFKGAYFWRIGERGLTNRYPAETNGFFKGLPQNFTEVDAVYERPDNKIVFFVKNKYYVFSGKKLDYGYPKPLTVLGLPSTLPKIDGAMVWGHNGKTYFFSGNMYWKFDEDTSRVEPDYPRDMSTWKGVGSDIDTVFQWKDGKTYFFKGKGFWKFSDIHMRVEDEEQKLSAPFWMGCTDNMMGKNNRKLPQSSDTSSSNFIKYEFTISMLALVFLELLKSNVIVL